MKTGRTRVILEICRPGQWIKNLLLFSGLIFGRQLAVPGALQKTLLAFFVFSIISSAVYVLNDIVDRERDRLHPLKKKRPIAAGLLSTRFATGFGIFLFFSGVTLSLIFLNMSFSMILLIYFILMISYTLALKKIMILDVIVIASGFVLRAIAGAVVLRVIISPWLILCTFLLALFLALGKRRNEWIICAADENFQHRVNLQNYSLEFLDTLLTAITACTLMAYSLYTFDERTIHESGTHAFPFTIPFVVYGIFRYLYLVRLKDLGGEPERVLFLDRPLLLNTLLWGLVILAMLYRG